MSEVRATIPSYLSDDVSFRSSRHTHAHTDKQAPNNTNTKRTTTKTPKTKIDRGTLCYSVPPVLWDLNLLHSTVRTHNDANTSHKNHNHKTGVRNAIPSYSTVQYSTCPTGSPSAPACARSPQGEEGIAAEGSGSANT